MGDYLKDFLASGKKLLTDTKTPKQIKITAKDKSKLANPAAGSGPETDPHKVFVKRAIDEKLKKEDIVKQIQKFCDAADALL
jgi:hypothetical protein